MKIISQKREYHRKSVKVMRQNDKADICNNNWIWVVALERSPPPRWLRCVWQLTGGLGCGSGKVRDITEVPEEGHDELCYSGKAWWHVRDLCKVVNLCMALLRAKPMLSFLRHFCSVFLSPSPQVSVAHPCHWWQSLHNLMFLNFSYGIGIHFLSLHLFY